MKQQFLPGNWKEKFIAYKELCLKEYDDWLTDKDVTKHMERVKKIREKHYKKYETIYRKS